MIKRPIKKAISQITAHIKLQIGEYSAYIIINLSVPPLVLYTYFGVTQPKPIEQDLAKLE